MWKPLTVKCKETGKELCIKDFRFNPELHEKIEGAVSFEKTSLKEEETVDQSKLAAKIKAANKVKEEKKPKKKKAKK
mgnify:CR=1 FL=1|jgi:hypothetical protein